MRKKRHNEASDSRKHTNSSIDDCMRISIHGLGLNEELVVVCVQTYSHVVSTPWGGMDTVIGWHSADDCRGCCGRGDREGDNSEISGSVAGDLPSDTADGD